MPNIINNKRHDKQAQCGRERERRESRGTAAEGEARKRVDINPISQRVTELPCIVFNEQQFVLRQQQKANNNNHNNNNNNNNKHTAV